MTNPIRVLYADDEADIRGIIEYALEDEPDIVLELCESGQEALDKVTDFQPDLILLDVMMPGMDGPTTLNKLREHPATRNTPIIFVTAKVQANEVAQFKDMGAIDVIAKPFDPVILADHLRKQLELTSQGKAHKKAEKFAALRQTFVADLGARLYTIDASWERIKAQSDDISAYEEMHRLVHSLVGSGMSFGFTELGTLAREIETIIAELMQAQRQLDAQNIEAVTRQLQTLRQLANAATTER